MLSVLVFSACGLFPDLSGLAEKDAGVLDAPVTDASGDVATTDAPPDVITTPDGAATWCATQDAGYRLCADYDESNNVTQSFDSEGQVGVGGTLSISTSTFVSASQSAFGIANPFGPGQTSGDREIKALWALGATPGSISCTLQWDPVALSTTQNDYAHVISIGLYADSAGTQALVSYNVNMLATGQLVLLEYYPNQGSANATHVISSSIAVNTWRAVTLTFSATAQTYSASYGTSGTSGVLAKPVPSTSFASAEIGPAYFGGSTTTASPGWAFGYDNVICY